MENEKLLCQPNKTLDFSSKIPHGWQHFLNLMNTSQKKNGNTEIDEIMKTELNICKSYTRNHSDKFRLVHKYVNARIYFSFIKSLKFHIR
jgi:hypothetical protein